MSTGEQWNDHRMEGVIGNLLRTGVILSAALVAAGGSVYLARHGGERVDRGFFEENLPTCGAWAASCMMRSPCTDAGSFNWGYWF